MNLSRAGVLPGHTSRFAVVGVLVLVMLIPLAMVRGVSAERQRYFETAAGHVAAAWGGSQALAGPFLLVPETRDAGSAGSAADQKHWTRVVLPESLDVSVEVRHETRSRGIYQVPVYQAVATFEGTFVLPEAPSDVGRPGDGARLVVGISDPRAVESISELEFAGTATPFAAGTGDSWLREGAHAAATTPGPGTPAHFSFQLALRGSGTFAVAPVGSTSGIDMTASWPHPSFNGRFLPSEHEISADGFSARWTVRELARGLLASWVAGSQPVDLGYAEASLFQPVTGYTLVERGIKYGVLFIGLTYLAFICFEMLAAVRFHYVQYAVLGAGMVLFYLALLSLSEALPFLGAYVVAALLLCALVTWYAWMITRRRQIAAAVGGILVALYACLYVLLELEDYALLVGTGVLFAGLFALMYATSRLEDRTVSHGGV